MSRLSTIKISLEMSGNEQAGHTYEVPLTATAKDEIKLLFLDLVIKSSDTDAAKMIDTLRTKIGEL